ncbi:hypothetical protein NQZ68_021185, partial [Dissostichus eleginoides]
RKEMRDGGSDIYRDRINQRDTQTMCEDMQQQTEKPAADAQMCERATPAKD